MGIFRRKASLPAVIRSIPGHVPALPAVSGLDETEFRRLLQPLPSEFQEQLWQGRRPAILYASRLCSAGDQPPLGRSKLGGLPDLPVDLDWPTWTGHDNTLSPRPLVFFAQLELSSVSAHLDLDLPSDGSLLFFADFDLEDMDDCLTGLYGDELEGARVIFVPAGTQVARTNFPSPVGVLPEAVVTPLLTWTFAHPDFDDEDQYDEFCEVDEASKDLVRSRAPEGFAVDGWHQLGGNAENIQQPIEQDMVRAAYDVAPRGGTWDSARWEAVADQVPLWTLLFQFGSDDSLDLMFGDVGMLYWAAPKAAVAAGDFSSARFTFQGS